MNILGLTITTDKKLQTLNALNERLSVNNQQQASIINQLKHDLSEHRENNRKLYAYQKELETLNQKLGNEIDIANTNYKVLTDQKAEIEQERLELQKQLEELQQKYNKMNQTLDVIRKTWEKDHLLPLKAKLAQVQGRLGAYIKKYGELPHKRENERKRKQNRKANETTQNPTAN